MPTFDTSPRVGEKVVVETADNVYVGVVRGTSLHPYRTITLSEAYDSKKQEIEIEKLLMEQSPNDQWDYFTKNNYAFDEIQAKIDQINAEFHHGRMKRMVENPNESPFLRGMMLRATPASIQAPYRMNANMNMVSKNPFEKLPQDVVRQHIIGLTNRPTKHAGRRRPKTKRKKTKHKYY